MSTVRFSAVLTIAWLSSGVLVGCSTAAPEPSRITRDAYGAIDQRSRNLRQLETASIATQIQVLVQEVVDDGHYPGLLAGLVIDGRVAAFGSAGVADIETGAPVTRETSFRLASITKTMTGLLTLHLRDRGVVRLDRPLEELIPELSGAGGPDSSPITLRQLLTHTSGLPRNGTLKIDRHERSITDADLLAALDKVKLAYPSGTDVLYSNLGFATAGLALSRSTGTPFPTLFQTYLFEPLGMSHTGFEPPRSAMAMPYVKGPRGFRRTPVWKMGAAGAMGGLFSTLDDMARWIDVQTEAWPPRPSPETLPVKRATIREAQRSLGFARPGRALHGAAWGLSVQRGSGEVLLSHTGATYGFTSVIRVLPESGVGVIAFANAGNHGPIGVLSFKIMAMANRLLRERGLVRILGLPPR